MGNHSMHHYASLESLPVSRDVRDVRGATVRGSDGKKPGKVEDVIVDHDTMEIRYLVVDSGGYADETDGDALASELTRQEIENSPRHDTISLRSKMNGIDTKRDLGSIGKRSSHAPQKTPTG